VVPSLLADRRRAELDEETTPDAARLLAKPDAPSESDRETVGAGA
jgi:hypothetical protein